MSDVEIVKASVNLPALDGALRAAFSAAISGVSFSKGVVRVHFIDEATTEQAAQAAVIVTDHDAMSLTIAQQTDLDNRARRAATRTQFGQLTNGLSALSIEDRSYVITARIMAYKDGAGAPAMAAIVDKATAIAYVTGKEEWTNATAATRALVTDVLETMAGMVQVVMLVLE